MKKYGLALILTSLFLVFFTPGVFSSELEVRELIQATETNLEKIKVQLEIIESSDFGNGEISTFVVSVPEIKNKIDLTYLFLDQAVDQANRGVYDRALLSAREAKENSELAVFYLDALLRDARRFNLSELFLQGNLEELLNIRSLLRLLNPSLELVSPRVLPPTDPVSEEVDEIPFPLFTDPVDNNEDLSAIVEEESVEGEALPEDEIEEDVPNLTDSVPSPVLSDNRLQCLETGVSRCQNDLNTCLARRSAPVYNCQVVYENRINNCSADIFGSSSGQNQCDSELNDCLITAGNNSGRQNACQNQHRNCQRVNPVLNGLNRAVKNACRGVQTARLNICENRYEILSSTYERYVVGCQSRSSKCVDNAQIRCVELSI